MVNLLAQLPDTIFEEKFESLVTTDKVRIERIVSHGQTSPEFGWYDQDEHEWVMVLKGHAVLEFFDGETLHMQAGDAIDIKAHVKHKVLATALDEPTVWLAVFYQ
ncbi:cupin domain-containing protein [Vibrio astriarenae]